MEQKPKSKMERFPKKKYMGVWSRWEDMTAVRMRKFPRRAQAYSAENRKSRTFSRPAVSGMPSKVNSVTIVWFVMFIEESAPEILWEEIVGIIYYAYDLDDIKSLEWKIKRQ